MTETEKKELIAELAGEVLHEIYFNPVFLPDGLYTKWGGKVTQSYTEDAQELFNDLHDVIESTVESYLLNKHAAEQATAQTKQRTLAQILQGFFIACSTAQRLSDGVLMSL